MSVREDHVPVDRLTALAFVARAPESSEDCLALAHISACEPCAFELARLTAAADDAREAACAEADRFFDDALLESQRGRILDRLAHLGQAARVLRFPARTREVAMPVSTNGRRWVSVSAAAGLILGLVAGQLVHFVPWTTTGERDPGTTVVQSTRPSGPGIVATASVATPMLSDDELLDEIESAVQLRRANSLRALDALTPTANDFLERSIGQ